MAYRLQLKSEDIDLIKSFSPTSFFSLENFQNDIYLIDEDIYIEVLQDDIDDAIVHHGMDEQYELTDLGGKLQALYDKLYLQVENQ